MKGTIRLLSVFDEKATIELGMLAFVVADDPVWEIMIKDIHDYFTIIIDSVTHVIGSIHDIDQLLQNDLNSETKILVVGYEDGFLPIRNDDCLSMAKRFNLEIGSYVEYEISKRGVGYTDVAVISKVLRRRIINLIPPALWESF
jgi:hypothetical protein